MMRLLLLLCIFSASLSYGQVPLPSFRIESGKQIKGVTTLFFKDSITDEKLPTLSLVYWMIKNLVDFPEVVIQIGRGLKWDSLTQTIMIDSTYGLRKVDSSSAPLFIKGDTGPPGPPGVPGPPGTPGSMAVPNVMTKAQILAYKPGFTAMVLGTDGKLYIYDMVIKRWRAYTGTPQ